MKYLKQLGIILIITFISEILKYFIPLTVPAGIYGMAILFLLLCTKLIKPEQIEETSDYLISIMGVMFIPAGVGIINNADSMLSMLPEIIISVVVVTLIVMCVSGKVTEIIIGKEKKDGID